MAVRSELSTVRGLRSRCSLFRAELADRGTSADVLRAHWPGGRENPDSGLSGWIFCYGSYRTLLDGGHLTEESVEAPDAALNQLLLNAALDKPLAVALTPAPTGEPRTVTVYPKSYDALVLVDILDDLTKYALRQAVHCGDGSDAAAALRRAEYMRAVALNHQTMAWIACTPGPGAPFQGLDWPSTIPAPFCDLTPIELVLVMHAYHRVNREAHAQIASAIHGTGDGKGGGSWVSLAVGAAARFGERVEDLLRNRSLSSWLAQLVVSVRDTRPAKAED